ncbi:hypothetical protein PSCLAVI8L_150105 [Pseudoclavibacter sp. 8L]|nr:hypothetical protein PSCLAVI8L_150105 [Pseudoclavibacter sp. 8L]
MCACITIQVGHTCIDMYADLRIRRDRQHVHT